MAAPPYLALLLVLSQAPPVTPAPPSPEALRREFLIRLNVERTAAGVPLLRPSAALDEVAQQNAEDLRQNPEALADESAIPKIQRRLRRAGYEAHGWHQELASGPDEPAALVSWLEQKYPQAFRSLLDGDYQEVGIGISDLHGTPLYTFLLAWRESESFARQTAGLANLQEVRSTLLARANAERAAAGLPPLALDARLNAAAQRHAEDMLQRSYYSHFSPDGAAPADRVRRSGYNARLVAENIARGPFTVDEVMTNWLASEEHRRNLLHPGFTDLGVGVAVGRNSVGNTVLWVLDFGRPGGGL
jgi:uncharacterized protein YkwD